VLPVRIELTTSPLPRECSTTELRQRRRATTSDVNVGPERRVPCHKGGNGASARRSANAGDEPVPSGWDRTYVPTSGSKRSPRDLEDARDISRRPNRQGRFEPRLHAGKVPTFVFVCLKIRRRQMYCSPQERRHLNLCLQLPECAMFSRGYSSPGGRPLSAPKLAIMMRSPNNTSISHRARAILNRIYT
jgi:hypothetical protein